MSDPVDQVIETGQSSSPVATFIRAYALGMVKRYVDDRPTSREVVVQVTLRAVGVFMTEPDSAWTCRAPTRTAVALVVRSVTGYRLADGATN